MIAELLTDVQSGWLAVGISVAVALVVGPWLRDRLEQLEDTWTREDGDRS